MFSWLVDGKQDAAIAVAIRRRLIEGCPDTHAIVMTAYFPAPTAGRVVTHGDSFRFQFTPV
jgi:hypothetical protein